MNTSPDISQDKTLLWLMALACGLCAGANYYCQPLINSIHTYFQVPESQVALTVTFAQVSYALGLLFIVPVGDTVNKTKFIPLLMFLAAFGLFLCAFSVNLPMLWIGTIMTGLFSVAAQILIPFATMSVKPDKMGEVVGLLMSGLLVGILLSTSLAGLLSNLYGWQLIYIISGVLMMGLAIILKKRLPHIPTVRMAYGKILHSMLQLIRQEKRLVYRALIGASAFAAMSVLFSTIAVLLGSSFGLPDVAVGLVTLIGVFGALSTKKIGKIADRGHGKLITWAGLSLLAVSWSFLYFGAQYLWSYIIGFGLINLGLASVHTSNQNVIFHLRPDAKSRLNAVYMTSYFIGGACGSALGIYAWHHGGWSMSCLVGLTLVLCSACFAWLDQQHLRRQQLA
ncbi:MULTISPECIES: MFS transporter [Acinetobacter]|uniref:MFS transporter n=1 Tax=Acinetobacter TaxID=469 RepID=UPI000948C89D|nr:MULTISPECIES: MFS transporter [Acinetobacter]MCO8100078.1 MFS transporter [Acinetobacter indicus]MCO8101511.1 MFS transporter [Acinetobacter indicus]MCO8105579.1 MFS transporter [Acinetobacter indicus]MCO8111291.1 MFS transporter [Acinetobacter indicus]MDM1243267.1 MFS transporter [Acinetobacter indicus]